MTPTPEYVTFIALERGAAWPSWGSELRQRAPSAVVEAALEGESPADFYGRVAARLRRLTARGVRVRAAAYVCSLDQNERGAGQLGAGQLGAGQLGAEMSARRSICAALLSALGPGEDTELILGGLGSEDAGSADTLVIDERAELMQLCGELSLLYPGRTVSVRFETREYESGVYPTSPGVPAPSPREFTTSSR